jgi:hypothetical protein
VDVRFELRETGRLPGERRPGEPESGAEVVYRSPERLPGGESVLTATDAGPRTMLRFADAGAFSVGPGRIVARPEGPRDAGPLPEQRRTVLELRLLGPVLAFWLERAGRAALHAASVTVAGRSVGFLSSNHGGKTSLAAALMALGRPMLTDDVLAVEEAVEAGEVCFRGHPGYPQMRLWPADLERFLPPEGCLEQTPKREFPRVHPGFDKVRVPVGSGGLGAFDAESRPLGCLYVPDRREGVPIDITAIPRREALMALIRHSFLPRLVAAMGWQERRLDLLARLADRVPVRRLTYPTGHGHLPEVARAVLDDLDRL